MALQEHDREDLFRDGRTMVVRGECQIDGTSVLVGFRSGGQLSLYWGADPVYQFNAAGQLRRVFFRGRRFAAEQGALLEWARDSRGGRVTWTKRPIDEATQSQMCADISAKLQVVAQHADDPAELWRIAGDQPASYRAAVTSWIDRHGSELSIAQSPNA